MRPLSLAVVFGLNRLLGPCIHQHVSGDSTVNLPSCSDAGPLTGCPRCECSLLINTAWLRARYGQSACMPTPLGGLPTQACYLAKPQRHCGGHGPANPHPGCSSAVEGPNVLLPALQPWRLLRNLMPAQGRATSPFLCGATPPPSCSSLSRPTGEVLPAMEARCPGPSVWQAGLEWTYCTDRPGSLSCFAGVH